jgi:protein-S-isoprenylcysteine O-methyltransferase Ste14
MTLDGIENIIRWVGVAIGLATLAFALWQGIWRGLQQPPGRTTGNARIVLRTPLLLIMGLLWLGICFILWRPVPFLPSTSVRIAILMVGTLLYFLGLALYLWGAKTLGTMYKPSSAFGVQLNVEHKLITYGPFALVRHPLYLGLQVAAVGGLLVYRNWTFVFIAVNFLGLFFRARREEQALAAEFGKEWEMYASQVPAWMPHFRRKSE